MRSPATFEIESLESGIRPERSGNRRGKLSWPQCTLCLTVEAIAVGILSVARAFATLGLLTGLMLCIGIGLLAIHTSITLGKVALKYPEVRSYAGEKSLAFAVFI
jgi:hypothetical protein